MLNNNNAKLRMVSPMLRGSLVRCRCADIYGTGAATEPAHTRGWGTHAAEAQVRVGALDDAGHGAASQRSIGHSEPLRRRCDAGARGGTACAAQRYCRGAGAVAPTPCAAAAVPAVGQQ